MTAWRSGEDQRATTGTDCEVAANGDGALRKLGCRSEPCEFPQEIEGE